MDTANITITKASLEHGMFLKVSFEKNLPNNVKENHPNFSRTTPVHEDLVNSFHKLTGHMALICEEITMEDFISSIPNDHDATEPQIIEMGELAVAPKKGKGKPAELPENLLGEEPKKQLPLDPFTISEITLKLKGGVYRVSLSGHKRLTTGKHKKVISPEIKLEHDDYKMYLDLGEVIEEVIYEILEYIINDKKAPERQKELQFPDGIGQEEILNAEEL